MKIRKLNLVSGESFCHKSKLDQKLKIGKCIALRYYYGGKQHNYLEEALYFM